MNLAQAIRLASVLGEAQPALPIYHDDLYIDEEDVLYRWDVERPNVEARTPVTLSWRYGEGDEYRSRRYHRYLDTHDVAQTVDR